MSSRGVREPNSIDKRLIKGLITNHENFIQSLRVVANSSTVAGFGSPEGSASNAPLDPSGNYLNKSGDTMMGPFGNDFVIVGIEDGVINVGSDAHSKPLILLNPEAGEIDEIDTIIQGQNVFYFQELWIITSNEDITFTENGNIITQGGGDFIAPPETILKLIYHTVLQKWVIVASSVGGGSGESNRIFQGDSAVTVSDLGAIGAISFAVDGEGIANMTTAFGLLMSKDLNMGNYDIRGMGDIYFTHPVQAITSRENGLNYAVNENAVHDFFVSTILKFEIGNFVKLHTTLNLSDHNLLLNNSSRIQGELIPDVAFRNFGGADNFWGSMFGGKLYIKTEDVNIDTLNKEMIFNVPDEWGYEWRINGTQAISIRKDGSLDISNENLQRVGDIEFMNDGQKIQSTSTSLIYDVPEDEFHTFIVDNVVKLTIGTSAISVSDDIQMNDNDIDLGSGSFKSSTNRGVIRGGADSDGSIRIQVGNTIFRIPYFF